VTRATAARWDRVSRLLDEALDKPPAEWPALLDARCAGDPALRTEVEALLAADQHAEGFMEQPAVEDAGLLTEAGLSEAAPAEGDGRRIGAWRVVGELGRGGMGTVYLVERADGQFKQRAALKLLRGGFDRAEFRERFLRERQILARLSHSGIARLLDGGLDGDGTPYFVLECVEGRPITAYGDEPPLGLEGRLALFRQVCEAVEYAHAQLVVHRDLKPSNILVTPRGEVKLVDFGIAKLLDEDAAGGALTATTARALTPAYAAPEQFLGGAVTVATDVYQLGLVLYELLTGTRAYGAAATSPLALERLVLEIDPERPSRAVGPGERARRLAGDLDAIVLKALRKEPEQRYPSVEALRRDVDDFLQSRPVAARQGTASYRLRKYVRRHRVAVSASALAALSLAAGMIGIAVQARVAAGERDRARAAEARATAINDFVVHELLESATPEKSLGRSLTVAEVLDNASRSVAHAFGDVPATEADVRLTLARTYASLGRFPEARGHALAARERLEGQLGAHAPEALRARTLLAELAADLGRYGEARNEIEAVLSEQAALDPAGTDALESRAALGRVLTLQGEWAAAESVLRDALAAQEQRHPEQWRLAVELRGGLVDALIGQHKAVEAEAACRRMLALQERHLGPEHPEIAATLDHLATTLQNQLRYADALPVAQRVVEMRLRLQGEKHPATGDALLGLALIRDRLNQYAEALDVQARALAILRNTLGPRHPRAVLALRNLGMMHSNAGDFREAERIYRESFDLRRQALGEDHPSTIAALRDVNEVLVHAGRMGEAREVARRVVAAYGRIAARPDADPQVLDDYAQFLLIVEPEDARAPRRALTVAERAVATTERKRPLMLKSLGMAQQAVGRPDLAIATLREALALPEGTRSWTTEDLLVDLLEEHRPEQVEKFLLDFLAWQRAQRQPGYLLGKTVRRLALHDEKHGQFEQAERRFRESLGHYRQTQPESDWEVGRVKSELGGRLTARGAFAEAETLLVQGHKALAADNRVRPQYLESSRQRLVALYGAWGRPQQAQAWRSRAPHP
jgi:tetratricopeptide (TPR) repeat protein/tRNA A-37 threonylcarbamoyl transferase component Bud32